MQVTVIDDLMGRGKTSYAIQMMQEAPSKQKFIYVTPLKQEITRIQEAVPQRNFRAPEVKHGSGTKLQSLKRLIADGEDIATTHALFSMADDELIELLRWENYTLVLDEVMEVISILQTLKKDDIPVMLKSGLVTIADDGRVIWTADPDLSTKYDEVKHYALSGNLYAVNNTAFVWNFPAKTFALFNRVYVLTYLFKGQIQRYYYDLHGIEYEYFSVMKNRNQYSLIPKDQANDDHSSLKRLIHVYDGKYNDVGDNAYALSKRWFSQRHNKPKVDRLKRDLYSYIRNVHKAKADEILWTTFKDAKSKIQGKGFSREELNDADSQLRGKACFTAFNLRATNQYSHKTILAFCLNRFMNPIEEQFFQQHNVTVDEDLLALSDLLQWLFRSAVRDGKPVDIYVPSRRMRELLIRWLDNDIDTRSQLETELEPITV